MFEQYLTGFSNGVAELTSVYRDRSVSSIECGSVVVVGVRIGNDDLYKELHGAGVTSLRSIGDCRAPGTIAHAVYSGHEYARTIDAGDSVQPFQWERARLTTEEL